MLFGMDFPSLLYLVILALTLSFSYEISLLLHVIRVLLEGDFK